MQAAQPQEETIYFGFKFDVVKIADHLYKIVDQVTHAVRDVEHDPTYAIESAKNLDRFAGWKDIDDA